MKVSVMTRLRLLTTELAKLRAGSPSQSRTDCEGWVTKAESASSWVRAELTVKSELRKCASASSKSQLEFKCVLTKVPVPRLKSQTETANVCTVAATVSCTVRFMQVSIATVNEGPCKLAASFQVAVAVATKLKSTKPRQAWVHIIWNSCEKYTVHAALPIGRLFRRCDPPQRDWTTKLREVPITKNTCVKWLVVAAASRLWQASPTSSALFLPKQDPNHCPNRTLAKAFPVQKG